MGGSPGPEGNNTRPLSRKAPGPPLKALYAVRSRESLLVVVGLAGEGEVARNNIKSAASLSVGAGRGVVESVVIIVGGGVRARNEDSVIVDDDAPAEIGGPLTVVVRAELCAK